MKCDELKDRWFWAYPTEAVDCDGISGSAHEVYGKSDVDEVIAEKDKEIAELKRCLKESHDARFVSCGMCEDEFKREIAELKATVRRLKRALYKACANWADVEVFERTVGIDDPNIEAGRWAVMRNKCSAMAERFGG